MIKRVGEGFEEGDIIEFNKQSEPLYIYHNGELVKITPQEYNLCTVNVPKERWNAISKLRYGI